MDCLRQAYLADLLFHTKSYIWSFFHEVPLYFSYPLHVVISLVCMCFFLKFFTNKQTNYNKTAAEKSFKK